MVVVATGRLRRTAVQTCFSSEGPCSQSTFKISISPPSAANAAAWPS